MASEEATVFDSFDRVSCDLPDVYPGVLPCGGDQIEPCQSEAKGCGDRGSDCRAPAAGKNNGRERDSGQQVAGHYAKGGIGEPGSRDYQCKGQRGAVECSLPD